MKKTLALSVQYVVRAMLKQQEKTIIAFSLEQFHIQ